MMHHLPYDRAERVADEIYRIVAEALVTDLSNPRLAGVRVTRVRMTKDLRTAYVSYHLDGATEEARAAAGRGLESSRGFFKRRIGEALTLKFMPEIEFFYDEAVDVEQNIDALLESVKRQA